MNRYFRDEIMILKSINPYTEEVNWTYDSFTIEECEAYIANSRIAFSGWSSLSVEERTKYLTKVAEVLRQNIDFYAEIITKEMGKPIKQSRAEIQKCGLICDYYVKNAAEFLKDELVDTDAAKSYVTFNPLGVILGIMPWNFKDSANSSIIFIEFGPIIFSWTKAALYLLDFIYIILTIFNFACKSQVRTS